LRAASAHGGLSKFFDVNLTQLLRDDPARDTLEVRILPGALHADEVIERARLIEGLLECCCSGRLPPERPIAFDEALRDLSSLALGADLS